MRNTGPIAPLLLIPSYAMAAVLSLPGSVFTLTGGAVLGTQYHLIGAALGAALVFIIARYLASNWVVEKAHRRVKQVINGIRGESSRFVACCRALSAFIAVARYWIHRIAHNGLM